MKKLLFTILLFVLVPFCIGLGNQVYAECTSGLCCSHDQNGVPSGHPNCYWTGSYKFPQYTRCTWQEFQKSGLSYDQLEVFSCVETTDGSCDLYSQPDDAPSFVAGCGNTRGYCQGKCQCEPRSCPKTIPGNKFRTREVYDNGSAVRCLPDGTLLNCSIASPCAPSYYNTPPACAFKQASVSMTHDGQPEKVQLAVTDNDYGDTVQVVHARFVKQSGELSSCLKVKTPGGSSVENLTVKLGSDNPKDTTQITDLLLDPRESHGIFDNSQAPLALCSGYLELTIRDVDSDQSGPDISEETTCSVAVNVTNGSPKLTNVSIYDQDALTSVREPATKSMVDGRSALYVGVSTPDQSQSRGSYCNSSLEMNTYKCLSANENYISTHRNPFRIEFTISDPNGINDIMEAGIWIQNNEQNASKGATYPQYPIVAGGVRNSIQAMYSERENISIGSSNPTVRFVSRACLGSSCGPQNMLGSSRQIFSALAFTSRLPASVSANGNVKQEKTKSAYPTEWQAAGFPDCLLTTQGCVRPDNIPLIARGLATAETDRAENYDWAIAADESHLLCFASDTDVPTVVEAADPATCPSTCAACIKKEGVSAVSTDPNALKFAFNVYFNNSSSGQKLPAGDYSIYVTALDKVGTPIGNLLQRGKEGWVKFDTNGNLCYGNNGETCTSGNYKMVFDPVAPTITFPSWVPSSTTEVKVTASLADGSNGSGIAGVTNRFIARQEMLDGEPLGTAAWAQKSNGAVFNGANDTVSWSGSTITLSGSGLKPYDSIIAGLCVYDRAGNMNCDNSDIKPPYTFMAPWLKTSYGDVFSNAGDSSSLPYNMTIPANTATNSDSTKTLSQTNFAEQEFTALTGMLLTSGSKGSGIYGGNNGENALGFKNNYRGMLTSSLFNVNGVSPLTQDHISAKLHSIALLNCDRLNNAGSTVCNNNATIATMGATKYSIMALSANVPNLVCKGVNIIFVTGSVEITGDVTNATTGGVNSCVFVLSPSAKLTVKDVPSNTRTYTAGNTLGAPTVDHFDAGVILDEGALFTVEKGVSGTNNSTDRLVINGFIYGVNTAPVFKRNLAPVDNRRFPAEYVVYDSTLLDNLRPLLGITKTTDVVCGVSENILCK